jgi:hypothetical protein
MVTMGYAVDLLQGSCCETRVVFVEPTNIWRRLPSFNECSPWRVFSPPLRLNSGRHAVLCKAPKSLPVWREPYNFFLQFLRDILQPS